MDKINRREFLDLTTKSALATVIPDLGKMDEYVRQFENVDNGQSGNNTKSAQSVINLPKGGGAISGIGESFQVSPFTGTGNFSVPIATSPGRSGFGPQLSLQYSSGQGNSPFGMGWGLSVPNISRKTEKGVPEYQGEDVFLLSGAEDLVKVKNGYREENGYKITLYRPRVEGLFARIEYWEGDNIAEEGNSFWKITTKENITSIYGFSLSCRLNNPNPGKQGQAFQWLLELTYEAKGNYIRYGYKADMLVDLFDEKLESSRQKGIRTYQLYLKRILYGNLIPFDTITIDNIRQLLSVSSEETDFNQNHFFQVLFDYGEHESFETQANGQINQVIPQNIYQVNDPHGWIDREDAFSSYRAGFEIRTARLCKRVMMFHLVDGVDKTPVLVRSTDFNYSYNEYSGVAILRAVTQRGYRKIDNPNENTWYESEEIGFGKPGVKSKYYKIKSFPPLEFGYSSFQPEKQTFQDFNAEDGDMPPSSLRDPNYALIDLFGTGLTDVLYTSGAGTYYWKNMGEATFSRRRKLKNVPGGIKLEQNGIGFGNMSGKGQADLLAHRGHQWGYYESHEKEGWQDFRTYNNYPSFQLNDPNVRMVDLTGDGKADVLRTDQRAFVYFPCLGKKGFDEPHYQSRKSDLEEFPDVYFSDERVRMVDMTGDGLSDIVMVHSGRIDYWPNLGHGNFGRRVTMKNTPRIDARLDPSRLFLIDIDGSGPADLIYMENNQLRFWFNQSGNGWGEEFSISGTPAMNNFSSVALADMLGNGSTGVLWSTDYRGAGRSHYMFLDFTGGVKPNMLIEMDNNMGATTRVKYKPSTWFYLNDLNKRDGSEWVSSLPMVVQVLEKVEKIDFISKTKLVTKYDYHHGYYDGTEREFRGFAQVDQYDTDFFEQFSSKNLHEVESLENVNEGFHVPPVLTKTWFHNGIYDEEKLKEKFQCVAPWSETGMEIHDLFADSYYQKDPKAKLLNNTILETNSQSIDLTSLREAYRALRGQTLRQEVYALDGEKDDSVSMERQDHPYTVTESNVKVNLLQGRGENKHAVFYVHPHESIAYHYERIPDDPRVAHTFSLEYDAFGNMLKSATINYPRRVAEYPEQQQIRGTLSLGQFINETQNFHLIGVPYEQKAFEIGGLELVPNQYYLTFTDIQNQINQARNNTIDFDQKLPLQQKHLRLLSWAKNYFWNDAQDGILPLGEITQRALPHHAESAAFPNSLILSVFGNNINGQELEERGGYFEAESYWWNPGAVQQFYRQNDNKFFLPHKNIDPFGAETQIDYDEWNLLPIQVQDALLNVTKAEIDYHTLQPWKTLDINDNVSEILFDPLGLVQVTSIYGEENGTLKGDYPLSRYQSRNNTNLADILQRPQHYLQGTTSFFYYDLHAWRKDPTQPIHSVSLMRETHARELGQNEASKLQYHINFSDGLGREIQKKLKVEPGEAFIRNPDASLQIDSNGNAVIDYVNDRWLVSGRTVFNNKAKPVKQYEPFYSQTFKFEPEKEVTDTGITPIIHYDPLLRVIRTDTPKGFFAKTEFTPWIEQSWDLNDTIMESRFYQENRNNNSTAFANEKEALEKAAIHNDTATSNILNNLGQRFLTIEKNLGGHQLSTHYQLDIQGNELAITDPRQVEFNKNRPANAQVKNFQHVFDMNGAALVVDSVDAGVRLNLSNVLGQAIYFWNSRGFNIRTEYDILQRPIEVQVLGNGLDQIVEKFEYGASANDKRRNAIGQPIVHYDQAGITTNELFDIKGAVRKSTRQLREEYKKEVNWNNPTAEVLENTIFTTEIEYDALGRVKKQYAPDKSEYNPTYHQSGLLKSVAVTFDGDSDATTIVENISYDAKGQRKKIKYGNGVWTKYKYEEETFRLVALQSFRRINGIDELLQNIHYTYDPVGNITQIRDDSHEQVFSNNQIVDAKSNYTYDALYRLIKATGREHPALTGNEYKNRAYKQSQYLPLSPAQANNQQQLQNYERTYTYDDSGNLIKTRHIASDSSRSWTKEISPSETSNRAVPKDSLQTTTQQAEDFFDPNGNLNNLDYLSSIAWNYRDNIAKATLIPGTDMRPSDSEYYVYDSTGQRTRKVSERLINGETGVVEIIEKIYLGNYEIKRVKSQSADGSITTILEREALHIMDDQQRIVLAYNWKKDTGNRETDRINTRKFHYQLNNHLGSSAMELTDKAVVISYEEHFPYGGTAFIAGRNQKEVQLKAYRYSGKERDDFTGLYYYGMRYYAPWMRRWVSCDPLKNIDSNNLFIFNSCNPINFIDPKGLNDKSPPTTGAYRDVKGDHVHQVASRTDAPGASRRSAAQFNESLSVSTKDPKYLDKNGQKVEGAVNRAQWGKDYNGKPSGKKGKTTLLSTGETEVGKTKSAIPSIYSEDAKSYHKLRETGKSPVDAEQLVRESSEQLNKAGATPKRIPQPPNKLDKELKKGQKLSKVFKLNELDSFLPAGGKAGKVVKALGKAGRHFLAAIPIIGVGLGHASAAEAASRGDYTSAALDEAGMIPVAGDLLDAFRGGMALGETANALIDVDKETEVIGGLYQSAASALGFSEDTSIIIGGLGAAGSGPFLMAAKIVIPGF